MELHIKVSSFPTGDDKAARNRHGRQDLLNPAECQFNPITVGNFAFLFNCTPEGRTSDSMMVLT